MHEEERMVTSSLEEMWEFSKTRVLIYFTTSFQLPTLITMTGRITEREAVVTCSSV
jgi:hypothetical protein